MSYLNSTLDVDAVRQQLTQRGHVLVRDFFQPQVVDALHRALLEVDWALSYRDRHGDVTRTRDELRSFDAAARAELTSTIHGVAQDSFQFSFFSHSLVDAARAGQTDLLTRFVRWMANDEFLSLMHRMTGIDGLNRLYAQATLYAPGSFLLSHNDEVPVEDRRLAYVLNLTRGWRPDWGGLLHFCDAEGNVVETFFPHFNSLSLFTVPQDHFVSYVAPYAQGNRYAITGWLIRA